MKNLTKRKYSGIRQRNVNETVWNLYGYKFFKNEDCFYNLVEMAREDLEGYNFDVVIPIKPRNSGSDIVLRLATKIAEFTGATLVDCLNNSNTATTKKLSSRGYAVLIVDDVITSGRTAAKAEKAIRTTKPASIRFYAIAKANMK